MALQDTDTDMYADDSTLTAQAKSIPELEDKLSSNAAKVSTWCQENHMAANTTKTKGKNEPHYQKMKENWKLKWMVNTWKMLNLKNC